MFQQPLFRAIDLFLFHSLQSLLQFRASPEVGQQIVFWLFVFALTFKSDAQRYWQPLLVGLGWLTAALVLWRLAFLLGAEIGQAPVAGMISPTNPQQRFYFMLHFAVLLVSVKKTKRSANNPPSSNKALPAGPSDRRLCGRARQARPTGRCRCH